MGYKPQTGKINFVLSVLHNVVKKGSSDLLDISKSLRNSILNVLTIRK